MQAEFFADYKADSVLLEKVAALTPDNPFHTQAYIEAMRSLGLQVVVLCLVHDGQLLSACPAFIRSGRLNKTLEITSLPLLADADIFWNGLREFCRSAGVTILEINSYGSRVAEIPDLEFETTRTARAEY